MNGRKCFLFKHKIPLKKVNSIIIDGDFVLNTTGIVPVSPSLKGHLIFHTVQRELKFGRHESTMFRKKF